MSGLPAPMRSFFAPRSVAVIGATEAEGSVGRQLLWNLLASPFGGAVYPVNPHRQSVLGTRAYPSPEVLPEAPDLALVATPADAVPEALRACARRGVRAATVVSDGFTGPEGAARLDALLDAARGSTGEGRVHVLGPSSLGTMRPWGGLNATFARSAAQPRRGPVALFSQSGALLTAMLDWGHRENVGFSLVAALGEMADVGWADLLDYAAQDGKTESVLLYLQTVGDARALLSAAREVAFQKPVLVLRSAQREPEGAPPPDFGLPVTRDAVLEAALRRTGVLRVDTIGGLFHLAETLAKAPRPAGPRLAIVSNARGPARLAADALLRAGGQLAHLAPTLEASAEGPGRLDLAHTARPEALAAALAEAEATPTADGVLLILAPQPGLDPAAVAALVAGRQGSGKPVLASLMGAAEVAEADTLLNRVGVPTFAFPDAAAQAFAATWRYADTLRLLYETPALPPDEDGKPDREAARGVIREALAEGRADLSDAEAAALLTAYDLPAPPPGPSAAVPEGSAELLVGSAVDDQFGPVLVFGAGGPLAPVLDDHSLGLPPLTTTLARRLTERTRIARALDAHPGLRDSLDHTLVRFSQLVAEQPRVRAADVQFVASPEGLRARFARFRLHGPETQNADLPRPAVRPYPQQYVEAVALPDGRAATVRPIRPEDEPLVVRLHEALDEETVYLRYAGFLALEGRVDHARLVRKCFIDYSREMALVAEVDGGAEGLRLLGIGRLTRVPGAEAGTVDGEFGLLVADDAQGQGIGTLLLSRLVRVGRAEGLARIYADVLRRNRPMQGVARKLGFHLVHPDEASDPMVQVVLPLGEAHSPPPEA